jgi:signal transduction histidine kinase
MPVSRSPILLWSTCFNYRSEVVHNREGLGLGLYIAKEVATAHGGTLTVKSSEEETCFTFLMPIV